ncbi:MAG: bifunctional alpha,alpha-trehalose-phosphate synthase (UDP-forming)/trehalose-phosphatase [Bacteroidales bacterium]|nr:bifunctional alpha,alpha-trehalose-phosphate synthase (UDP-forming)/trehalose-phosphatase [Bacteroidales bacterium]
MSKILIVSNRLPLQFNIQYNEINVSPSVGGLATGMRSVHQDQNSKWIGWTGITEEEISESVKLKIEIQIAKEDCISVPLNSNDIEKYYDGFSNRTIWPLFHYFTEYTEYVQDFWDAYVDVNRKFARVVLENLETNDIVWIHDYQLLLLPRIIREKYPKVSIGFFLHIPFPSSEVFRMLPWREEILRGMLGSDLIGFHTYDYERHFLSTIRRMFGYDISFNEIKAEKRIIKADSFPMGIDYNKFQNAAIKKQQKSVKDRSKIQQDLDKHLLTTPGVKLILSIDRLDYTKGIAKRLFAFEHFLDKFPEYVEKVSLVMLCVPSRATVEKYQEMKNEVDQLVGRINGKYATINWTPIWYFYRSLPFENLIDLFTTCDVALLTPIRDGMNLVAKEYIASRIDKKGVLVLSEMTGASKEMSEAILINPNSLEEVASALNEALSMPDEEQIKRNTFMQNRLKRYNIDKWASEFLSTLNSVKKSQQDYLAKKITSKIEKDILNKFQKAHNRILFLDYDGTLTGFKPNPDMAAPDKELYQILDSLANVKRTELVLISGRDRVTFDKWYEGRKYSMITEHGVWSKIPGGEWTQIEQINVEWKDSVRPLIDFYVDRTPGSFLEEKNYSLVWHFRKADPDLGASRANELKDELTSLIVNNNLEILEGNKVIEIKNAGINKGRAAMYKIGNNKYDFILGIGDDWTDEYLFEELPKNAVTIKVGMTNTYAKYNLETFQEVRKFLVKLSSISF